MDRICLKVIGPGFFVGMTIDIDADAPIDTVGDLLRSLENQPELSAICRHQNCPTTRGDLYYRQQRLDNLQARLLYDIGIDYETLTRGGVETLEYRIHATTTSGSNRQEEGGMTEAEADALLQKEEFQPFKEALSTVLAQDDSIPTLNGLIKVLSNIVKHPDNPKYQKIKRANPKFQDLVGSHPGGIDVLLTCGFQDHVVLADGIDYIQFQATDTNNMDKLEKACKLLQHIQTQLTHARSLVESSQRSSLEVVQVGPVQESLTIYCRLLGPQHVLIAQCMNSLSAVLYAHGQDSRAQDLCRQAKEMVEALRGTEYPGLAPILANLAYMLRNHSNDRDEMQQLMTRALALKEPSHELIVLNNSAGMQMTLGNFDNAIAQWQQVLELIQESDPAYFIVVGNLARAKAESNDYVGAEQDYKQAVRVGEEHHGKNALQLAGILANLATVQVKLLAAAGEGAGDADTDHGRKEEALANFERALTIRESRLGFNQHLTQQAFRSLCDFLERNKDYSKLCQRLQSCYQCTEQAMGSHHPLLAKALMNAGLVQYRYQNDRRQATPLLRRAYGILQNALGPEHPETVMASIHLGSILRHEQPEEAESILVEAVSAAEFRNDLSSCLGPALSTLGGLDVDRNQTADYEMALIRLERGLELNQQEHGNDTWYTEMTRRDLGRVYQATGRPERAKNYYHDCLPYFQKKLIDTDERLVALLRDIEEISST